jgi:hypothetical protein
MLEGWMSLAAAVEGNVLATWLRSSAWGYPAVETLHISGLALLFGAAVAFDLQLLGMAALLPVDGVARFLLPLARIGFGLAVLSGLVLFMMQAQTVRRDAALLHQDGHSRHRRVQHDDLPPRYLHVCRSMEPCLPHAASCTSRRRRVYHVLGAGTRPAEGFSRTCNGTAH